MSIVNTRARGSIDINSNTQLWGAEINLVAHSIRDHCRRFDLIGGVRTVHLAEILASTDDGPPA